MEKDANLKTSILNTVKEYYPENIVETDDLRYIDSEETINRNKIYLLDAQIKIWNDFVSNAIPSEVYYGADKSGYRGYNFCYRYILGSHEKFCMLYSSVLFNGYCFVNFYKNSKVVEYNLENDFNSSFLSIYKSKFPNHVLIPIDILTFKPKSYMVQPFMELGQAMVFDYIFTNYREYYESFNDSTRDY
jgi:hypothetical protein